LLLDSDMSRRKSCPRKIIRAILEDGTESLKAEFNWGRNFVSDLNGDVIRVAADSRENKTPPGLAGINATDKLAETPNDFGARYRAAYQKADSYNSYQNKSLSPKDIGHYGLERKYSMEENSKSPPMASFIDDPPIEVTPYYHTKNLKPIPVDKGVKDIRENGSEMGNLEESKCELCHLSFPGVDLLQEHRKAVHGIKKFQCKYCSKRFNDKYNMRKHVLIHVGEKKHKCEFCEKKFLRKDHLRSHLQTHYNRKYGCKVCGKGFRTPDTYQKHMKIHKEDSYLSMTNDYDDMQPMLTVPSS